MARKNILIFRKILKFEAQRVTVILKEKIFLVIYSYTLDASFLAY